MRLRLAGTCMPSCVWLPGQGHDGPAQGLLRCRAPALWRCALPRRCDLPSPPPDVRHPGQHHAPHPAPPGTHRRQAGRQAGATWTTSHAHRPLCCVLLLAPQIQQRVFRSLEIGDEPKVPLPFPDTVVGTYSCHGIEPSYMDSKPFVAKINQDRSAATDRPTGHIHTYRRQG